MNGNPFYVPPAIPDMSDKIIQLGQMGMHQDNLAKEREMREKQFGAEQDYRSKMLANDTEKIGIDRQKMDIEERKLPASQQNFSLSDFLPFQATMKQRGYDKVFQPVLDTVTEWTKDAKVTKGVAASNLANQWDAFLKPQAIEGLQKEYLKLSENPNFKGSPKEKEILSMIDGFSQMSGEKAKAMFFPSVAQEEENTKAALQAQGDATRAAKLNPETQYINNRAEQYVKQGMSPEDATVKAYNDLSAIRSKQAREGRTQVNVGGGAGASQLTKESADQEGFKYLLTGKLPFTGMGGKGRTEMINAGWRIAKENGWDRNMVLRMQSDYKGMDKSVSAQRKNYDAMNGFVINMDRQMARLENVYKELPRSQYRLLNIPIVELRKKVAGSGEEAAAKAILIELGNESGKLSTNSASSIRELSESAQKQWEKIHDGYLSYNDIKKVLETTRGLGQDRINSTKAAMDYTLQAIQDLDTPGGTTWPQKPVIPGQTNKATDFRSKYNY
ncbi:MAG: hypothetical protein ABFD76_15415 [Smithella sp.]